MTKIVNHSGLNEKLILGCFSLALRISYISIVWKLRYSLLLCNLEARITIIIFYKKHAYFPIKLNWC